VKKPKPAAKTLMVLRELLEKSAEPVLELPEEMEIPDERTGTD
jgi:hypothetical protein